MSSRALLTWNDRYLKVLVAAWGLALKGQGQAILIGGEPGNGRSTLLAALRDALALDPGQVYRLRCSDLDSGVPYGPWSAFIDRHPEFGAMMPAPLGSAEPAAGSGNELGRRAARSLIDMFQKTPMLITVDDVHLSDEPSLVLLYRLIQEIGNRPVLVLVTHATPLAEPSAVAEFVPRMLTEPHASQIELEPAVSSEIEQALATTCPRLDPTGLGQVIEQLLDLSGGNRLFLAELLRSLEVLDPTTVPDVREHLRLLPTSLQAMIRYRLTQLPEDVRQTLRFAAIIGEAIDLDLLELLSKAPVETLLDQLELAIQRGLLVEALDGDTRFRHGAVQQALMEEFSALRKRRLHGALLATLIERDASPQTIAFHALASGATGAAYEALVDAGDRAMRVFALAEAAQFYHQAMGIADTAGIDDVRLDLLRLAYFDAIWMKDRDLASIELNRVAARAAIRNDSELQARANFRRSKILYETGQLAQAQSLLYETLPELEQIGDVQLLGETLVYCGFCASTLSDFPEVERVAERLLELSEEIDNAQFRAIAMHLSAHAMVGLGKDVERAPLVGRESVDIIEELGRLDYATGFAWVVFTSIDVPSNLEHPESVAQLVERGIGLNRHSDRLAGTKAPECSLPFAYWYLLQGDMAKAHDLMVDPADHQDARWSQTQRDIAYGTASELALIEGRYDDAVDNLGYIASDPQSQLGAHSFRQWILAVERWVKVALDQSEVELSREWVVALDQALEGKLYVPGELILETLRARIHLAAGTGDAQATADLMERTAARALQTHNMLAHLDALCLHAQCLAQLGEPERSGRQLALAIETAERCGLRYHLGLAYLTRAEVWAVVDGSRDDVIRDVEAALNILRDMNAAPAIRRAERLIGRYSRRSHAGGLTQREVEVLRLVAEGRTDAEVGEALYISHRTVSTHISNMLNKTGASNRVELTAWAIANEVVLT